MPPLMILLQAKLVYKEQDQQHKAELPGSEPCNTLEQHRFCDQPLTARVSEGHVHIL